MFLCVNKAPTTLACSQVRIGHSRRSPRQCNRKDQRPQASCTRGGTSAWQGPPSSRPCPNPVRHQDCGRVLRGSLPRDGGGRGGGDHQYRSDAPLCPLSHPSPARGEGEPCLLTNRVPNSIGLPPPGEGTEALFSWDFTLNLAPMPARVKGQGGGGCRDNPRRRSGTESLARNGRDLCLQRFF